MNASAFPPPSAPGNDARKDSLITYPSPFPIKVMGARADGFVAAITHIAREFDPSFDASRVELRESSGGKYLGITVTAVSYTHLDVYKRQDQTSGECDKAENVFHLMLLWMKSERLRKGKLKKTADQCCLLYTSRCV